MVSPRRWVGTSALCVLCVFCWLILDSEFFLSAALVFHLIGIYLAVELFEVERTGEESNIKTLSFGLFPSTPVYVLHFPALIGLGFLVRTFFL